MPTRKHEEYIVEKLRDPEFAAAVIEETLGNDDPNLTGKMRLQICERLLSRLAKAMGGADK